MSATRRRFLSGALASLGAFGAWMRGSSVAQASADEGGGPHGCLDYGLSFVCNPSPANAVRFWIESRTTLFDDEAGTVYHYSNPFSLPAKNVLLAAGGPQ